MASGSGEGSKDNADIPRGLINRMGNPIGRGSRLPSVRGHRDLTLGGKQRKVFTPNLAVKKGSGKNEASKQSEASSSIRPDQPKSSEKGRGRGKFERGRGRGRGRGEDRTIQLQSEFAYGPMGEQSSGGWSRGMGGSGGGGGSCGSRRNESDSTTVKITRQSNGLDDDKKFRDSLMRDDFLSDISSGDPHMKPIRLPLSCSSSALKQEVKVEPKDESMETDVKAEIGEADTKVGSDKKENLDYRKKNLKPPPTVIDVLSDAKKSERGELVFIQFPDTLPGCPLETDDKTSKEDELSQRLSLCQLKDCNEGFVGKLRIRKSGKADLVLGENVMTVLPGLPVNFQQELVSIRTDSDPGQMIVLGQVNHKLIVTPDYNSLLMETNRF